MTKIKRKLKKEQIYLYISHDKEIRKLRSWLRQSEENVIIDQRINDILVRRFKDGEDKYIANVEKIKRINII